MKEADLTEEEKDNLYRAGRMSGIKYRKGISKSVRYAVLKKYGWRCVCCGCKLIFDGSKTFEGEVAEIDHIHPVSKGHEYVDGGWHLNDIDNLQPLCKKCNLWKKDKKFGKDGVL